jgi:hypothetical protein
MRVTIITSARACPSLQMISSVYKKGPTVAEERLSFNPFKLSICDASKHEPTTRCLKLLLQRRRRNDSGEAIAGSFATGFLHLENPFMEIWGQQRSEESSACGAMQKNSRSDAKESLTPIAPLWEQEVSGVHINLASKKDDTSFSLMSSSFFTCSLYMRSRIPSPSPDRLPARCRF